VWGEGEAQVTSVETRGQPDAGWLVAKIHTFPTPPPHSHFHSALIMHISKQHISHLYAIYRYFTCRVYIRGK